MEQQYSQIPPHNVNNPGAPQEENFNFVDLLRSCIKHWDLFLISTIVCVAVGVLLALKAEPVYTRTATILIKETNVRKVSHSELETMLATAGQGSSKLANEVVAFQAPSLMSEAVRRLSLETEYRLDGHFHDTVLYGSQVPVVASFDDFLPSSPISFDICPSADGRIEVSHINYPGAPRTTFRDKTVITVEPDSTFSTPCGEVRLSFNPYRDTAALWTRPIHVVHMTNAGATRKLMAGFSTSEVSQKTLADVLMITSVDANPARACDLLNMLLIIYNENWVEDNNRTALSTSLFIKDRLAALEGELRSVDEKISGYKGENLIPDVGAVSSLMMSQRTDITRQLRELENQLSISKYLRTVLRTTSDEGGLLPTPTGLNNTGIINQVNEYNSKLLTRDNLLASSSARNPLVADLTANLESLRDAIDASVENQINTIEQQIHYLQHQEEQNARQIAASPEQAKDLLSYERQQKVQESLYLLLLQKREENELSQAFTAYNTRIINPPYGSPSPTSPHKGRMVLIAFIIGLCIPLGLIYLRLVLDTRVRGLKDLDSMNVPVLGELPSNDGKPRGFISEIVNARRSVNSDVSSIVVRSGRRDIINEAFRVLRTNFEFVNKSTPGKVNLLTSFNPGSGKTFISMNIASSLAIKGKKVLLIDGDFRKASLSRNFGFKHVKGLSDILAGESIGIDALIHETDQDNLFILPVGTIPPNPAEMLSSDSFENIIASLRERFDFIFIDSAPVNVVADTSIIMRVVDRCMFVVRCGLLERSMLPKLDQMYVQGNFPNMSVVLNASKPDMGRYSFRYGTSGAYGSYKYEPEDGKA